MKDCRLSAKRRIKNDIIVTLVLLALSAAALAAMHFLRSDGALASVIIDGKEAARFDLNEDREETFSTELGKNTVVIKNGAAYVSSADCPDGICASHAPIRNGGESIVCLPHKLVIKISSSGSSNSDIIS